MLPEIIIPDLPMLAKDEWKLDKERTVYFAIELAIKNEILFISKTEKIFTDAAIGTIKPTSEYLKKTGTLDGLAHHGIFSLQCFDGCPMGQFAFDLIQLYMKDIIEDKGIGAVKNILSLSSGRKFGETNMTTTLIMRFSNLMEYQILEDYYEILFTGKYNRRFITSLEKNRI